MTPSNQALDDGNCGIKRRYFEECLRTGELSLGQPTYRQCMDDRRCVFECVEAQVRRLTQL